MTHTWYNVADLPLAGTGWPDTAHRYDRLPARAEGVATDAVWHLSRQSTGMYVDFRTDATEMHARTILRVPPPENQSYIKYLDLYARDDRGAWRWAGFSKNGFIPTGHTPLIENLSPAWRTYRLYLPLFFVVERLEIGLPAEAGFEPLALPAAKPIVVYGTSIVNGHSASRPGMVWTSILGRRLDYPVVNLGFSGVARMEPPLGALLAELDPAVFVIDPLPNMSQQLVEENAEAFLRHLLAARPRTPIVLMEDRAHAFEWLYPEMRRDRVGKRAAYRALYEHLRVEGTPLTYIEGDPLIGDDSEATTDASHPSDLGFMRYADVVTPVIAPLIGR
jgi:hypothetical protein